MKDILICKNCKKEVLIEKRELNRGQKYCSRECSSIDKNRRISSIKIPNVKCSNCNKDFYKNDSKKKLSKSGLFFCCRKCKDIAQRIGGIEEIQPFHYGDTTNYREVVKREKGITSCDNCGYNKYSEILQVHHIDCNRNNNSIINLKVLCPTCHELEHFLTGTGRYRKKGGTCSKEGEEVLQTS